MHTELYSKFGTIIRIYEIQLEKLSLMRFLNTSIKHRTDTQILKNMKK